MIKTNSPVNADCPHYDAQKNWLQPAADGNGKRNDVGPKNDDEPLGQVPMPRVASVEATEIRQEVELQKVVVDVDPPSVEYTVDDRR